MEEAIRLESEAEAIINALVAPLGFRYYREPR
jgi:hypothetical protein